MHQYFTKPIVLHCKSVGFARQKRLFCIAKQPLSHHQTEITVFRRNYLYKTKKATTLWRCPIGRNKKVCKQLAHFSQQQQQCPIPSALPCPTF